MSQKTETFQWEISREIVGLEKFGPIVIQRHGAIIKACHWLEYSLFYIGKWYYIV